MIFAIEYLTSRVKVKAGDFGVREIESDTLCTEKKRLTDYKCCMCGFDVFLSVYSCWISSIQESNR